LRDTESKPPWDRHLWEFQPVRDLAVLAGVICLLALAWSVESVLRPVVVGVALAYIVNPPVTWLASRWRVPRWLSTLILLLGGPLLILGAFLLLVPRLVRQGVTLVQQTPEYLARIAERLGPEWQELLEEVETGIREWIAAQVPGGGVGGELTAEQLYRAGSILLTSLTRGINVVGTTVGFGTYLSFFVVVMLFTFFFISWWFGPVVAWFDGLLPVRHADRIRHIVRRMDMAVSSFLRGRLIQAIILGVLLSFGWWLAGVPYWLVLGLLAGVLNLVPFAALAVWPVAVLLALVEVLGDPGAGFSIWAVFVAPSLAYLVVQALDGWVVEPLVQGRATNLDPLSVLLAVLVGGALAGLAGMLVAIPVAACAKILGQEVVVPRLRELAGRQHEAGEGGEAQAARRGTGVR